MLLTLLRMCFCYNLFICQQKKAFLLYFCSKLEASASEFENNIKEMLASYSRKCVLDIACNFSVLSIEIKLITYLQCNEVENVMLKM